MQFKLFQGGRTYLGRFGCQGDVIAGLFRAPSVLRGILDGKYRGMFKRLFCR